VNTKQGLQLQLEEILPYLNKTRGPDKNGWYTALCPFHDDQHKPNLRFTDKGFQCMTCGEKGSLQKLAGRLGLKPEFKLIKTSRRIDSLYAYKDRDGNLIYQVVRYKPKSFAQRRPDGKGGWIYNLKGITPVLYRLPELLATPQDHVVFIAEGEKGVNSLAEHGLNATCSPMGAGKWREEYNSAFTNRSVVILPDNDEPGENHAQQVFDFLSKVTPAIQILHLPCLREKEDVFDWFAQGHTAEELLELFKLTPSQPDLNLAVLLDDIASFLRSFVVLSDYQLQAISLWVAHTHSISSALTTPYLNIYSAEKRSGKTRLLEVLEVLVARPWFTGRLTSAVLARKVDAECPTLLLDESDAAFKGEKEYSETLRGILNTGYRRGGKSSVCVGKGRIFL
jgi:hypothetical protein